MLHPSPPGLPQGEGEESAPVRGVTLRRGPTCRPGMRSARRGTVGSRDRHTRARQAPCGIANAAASSFAGGRRGRRVMMVSRGTTVRAVQEGVFKTAVGLGSNSSAQTSRPHVATPGEMKIGLSPGPPRSARSGTAAIAAGRPRGPTSTRSIRARGGGRRRQLGQEPVERRGLRLPPRSRTSPARFLTEAGEAKPGRQFVHEGAGSPTPWTMPLTSIKRRSMRCTPRKSTRQRFTRSRYPDGPVSPEFCGHSRSVSNVPDVFGNLVPGSDRPRGFFRMTTYLLFRRVALVGAQAP